jgi:hypothetical protein
MLVLASAEGVAGITAGATVAAALIIAGITARTTNRRQREALKHDRELADLADLRKLLDGAAVALDLARDARNDVERAFPQTGDQMRVLNDRLKERSDALQVMVVRLRVRLGEQEALVTHFVTAAGAVENTHMQISNFLRQSDMSIVRNLTKTIQTYHLEFRDASVGFSEAAIGRAGYGADQQEPRDERVTRLCGRCTRRCRDRGVH